MHILLIVLPLCYCVADFELQVGLLECISRLMEQRTMALASKWFSKFKLADQYLSIREEEFEAVCHL